MSERKLTLTIDSGATTCASEPGKFCRFFGLKKFGSTPVCLLFPENPGMKDVGGTTYLKEKDGWVQRCPACLTAEKTNGESQEVDHG